MPSSSDGGLALLAQVGVEVALDAVDDLLDARRVDAAVGDQRLDGLLGHLAADRVEGGDQDGFRRVVDDEVDAGGVLQGADVAALAADDAPLHLVGGQVDDRDRRGDHVLGGDALHGVGDDLLGQLLALLLQLLLDLLQLLRRLQPRLALVLLDDQVLGLLDGQARDLFQLQPLLLVELVDLLLQGGDLLFLESRSRSFFFSSFSLLSRLV